LTTVAVQDASEKESALGDESTLSFGVLSILQEGDEFVVGDPDRSVFLSVPEVGVVALRELASGRTVAEASAAAERHLGVDVNVLEFAEGLLAAGLVTAIDGHSTPNVTAVEPVRWIEAVRPEHVRPFFGHVAWVLYSAVALLCVVLFALEPSYWPTFEDVYFYPDPALCLAAVTLLGLVFAACHELCHWLAARAAGVAARFKVSRRFFVLVFETDLSQLWTLPRRNRYSPLLAGMAFDALVLAPSLGLRVAWSRGLLYLPPLVVRLLGVVVLLEVIGLCFQFLVFMRTDLYAVLITVLGCRSLTRVSRLALKEKFVALTPDEYRELDEAHPRDRRAASLYAPLYLLGVVGALYFFIVYFVPSTVVLGGWTLLSLKGTPVSGPAFWEALAIGVVTITQALAPLLVVLRDRRRRRLRPA
jgi:hypothetical protein